MATVISHMRTCGKTHRITVLPMNAEGNFDVKIESDCPKVQFFGENLKYLTMEDITDFDNTRLNKREVRGDMSLPCLAPIALLNAAWLEAEMLSRSLVKRVKENSIDFSEIQ
ncbi:MAG: hypothetical protein LBH69_02040 [Methanomassiliicoccaceae archaeon]|jgi:hypothetical protein|nr:hypothetical protein [Methanomassiliicoccaceae archaeon]